MTNQKTLSAHTSGPWEVKLKTLIFPSSDRYRGYAIADVSCRYIECSQKEQEANAQLIAAAPELLGACIVGLEMLKLAHNLIDERGMVHSYGPTLERMQHAIDSATQF